MSFGNTESAIKTVWTIRLPLHYFAPKMKLESIREQATPMWNPEAARDLTDSDWIYN